MAEPSSLLWPESTATSQLDPARLPPASLFSPDPPVHPSADLAVIRLEGLTNRPTPSDHDDNDDNDDVPGTATSMLGASLLSLDDIEQATDSPLETMGRTSLSSMLAGGRNRAQTLYGRQTMAAGVLLLVLFGVGAVTFPRSWRDPGPGLSVDATTQDDEPGSPAVDGIGPVVESDSAGGEGGNRGAIAAPGSSPARQRSRSTTTKEGDDEGESSTTSTTAVETSATVGPSGPGSGCPVGLPIAGCPTTILEPFGPTSSLIEATTSTTRVLVVSSSVPTTRVSTTTTTRPTTTRPPTTTTRPTTTRPTTTTTTTRPPTTTTTTPTTTSVTTTTIETTTTTTDTTTGPTESRGSQPTFVVCQDPGGDGNTPTTDCLPDP